MLLKYVEENYPLPKKPELLPGIYMPCFVIYVSFIFIILQSFLFIFISIIIDDGVKELQRKRHLASPDASGKSRVRKVAKSQPPSDTESDEESESELQANFD